MKKLLIAGCGDLGERLARRLDPKHWQVHGLRRNPSCLPAGIVPIGADLLAPDSLQSVRGDWDGIIYQATPAGRTAEAYEATYIKGLSNLLDQTHTARLIFVSSTGVYGQDDGAWVDEDAETRPSSFSGRILCAAEQIAHDHGGLVVRFSGIYGPGREYLIRSVQSGRARCRETPPQWTNRIHAEDCAAVLAHLLTLPSPAPVYCASDDRPVPRCEVLDWLATQLGVAPPQRDPTLSGQGKRVANQRLVSSGFSFQYPDYLSGYRELLS